MSPSLPYHCRSGHSAGCCSVLRSRRLVATRAPSRGNLQEVPWRRLHRRVREYPNAGFPATSHRPSSLVPNHRSPYHFLILVKAKSRSSQIVSVMGLRLLALTLRLTPATMRGTQRYYVEDGNLRWGAVRECKDGCAKTSWLGSGDSHFVPVGVDLRWKELRAKEHDTKETD